MSGRAYTSILGLRAIAGVSDARSVPRSVGMRWVTGTWLPLGRCGSWRWFRAPGPASGCRRGPPDIGLGGHDQMYAVDVGPDSSGIAHGGARAHGVDVKKIAFERLLGLLVGGELVAVAARGAP